MKKTSTTIETLIPEKGMVLKHKKHENVFAEQINSGTINEDDWEEITRAEYDAIMKAEEEKAMLNG